MAENKKKDAPLQLPSLHLIEEEGRKAADELAQEILRETHAAGGRVDMQRLGRAGPSVQSAYMRLLSDAILPPEPAESDTPARAAKAQPPRSTKPPSAPPPAKSPSRSRTKTGWQNHQRPQSGFAVRAFHRGLIVATILGTAAILATRALQL